MDFIFFFSIPTGAVLAAVVIVYALAASGSEALHTWGAAHSSLFFWIGIVIALLIVYGIVAAYIKSSDEPSSINFWTAIFISLILAPPIGIALMNGFLTFIIEYMTSTTPIISLFLAVPYAIVVILYQLAALIVGAIPIALSVFLTNKNKAIPALIVAGICAFLEYQYLISEAVIPFSEAFS